MTTISIVTENVGTEKAVYRAVAGTRQSQGRSVGEAIDALNSQLSDEESGTLVIVQNLRPSKQGRKPFDRQATIAHQKGCIQERKASAKRISLAKWEYPEPPYADYSRTRHKTVLQLCY